MSDVKRYEWDEDDGGWYCEGFTPVAGESLVLASDYDALSARLAESEAECLEQARLNGMGSEREARLIARLAEAEGKAAAYPHLMDVYDALGVRWGDNPFPIIDRLMGRATDSAGEKP